MQLVLSESLPKRHLLVSGDTPVHVFGIRVRLSGDANEWVVGLNLDEKRFEIWKVWGNAGQASLEESVLDRWGVFPRWVYELQDPENFVFWGIRDLGWE